MSVLDFAYGEQSASSDSRSTSDAYGYTLAGSGSRSSQSSESQSRSGGQSSQSIAFADIFSQLFGDAGGAAGRAALMVPGLQTQAETLFNAGTDFLSQVGGGAGARYLEDRLGGTDGILADQLAGLQEDVGRFFSEELLPEVTDRAVSAGQLGGGRQGVAQGRAIDTAAREFRRGATELRLADRQARDEAAYRAAQTAQQGAATGLAGLPGVYGLAEAGSNAELNIYDRLAQIYGGPTVLTESEQYATADASSIADAIARSFNIGEDFARSESVSSSRSKGWDFSLGFLGA